jgi:hypothetical protein
MVERLLSIREEDENGGVGELVTRMLGELSTRASMTLLKTAVGRGREYAGGPEELTRFLGHLEATSLQWIARHALELDPGPERDAYRGVLISRADPAALSLYIEGAGSEDVREVLTRFTELADTPDLARVLSMLLGHEDHGVASLALTAISGLPPEARQSLLGQAIGDRRAELRMAAYRKIEETRELRLLDTLVARLDAGGTESRERPGLIHAIAVLGGETAVACLRRHIGPRGLAGFWTRKGIEERRMAIVGLRDVTDVRVKAFLAEGISSKDRRFAEACRDALGIDRSGS